MAGSAAGTGRVDAAPDEPGDGRAAPAPEGGTQAVAQASGHPGALVIGGNAALNVGDEPIGVLALTIAPVVPLGATPAATASTPVAPVGTAGPGTTAGGVATEVLLAATFSAADLSSGPAYVDFWWSS